MNKEYIGRTVDEAIQEGLNELHLNREDVDVLVLDEGSRGVLGLFGAKMARVMIVVPDTMESFKSFTIEDWEEEERQEAEEQPEVVFKTLDQALAEQEEETKDDFVPLTEEELSESAAKVNAFLTTVAGYMGVDDPGIAIARGERGLRVRMEGDKIGIMIGHRGETLDALQLLAGLVANQNRGDSDEGYQRVSLDIGSYRRKREQTLVNLAHRLAQKAIRSHRNVSLEPMNSYERRIIHSTLASVRGVDTHSEGEDPYRHVVIQPKK